MKIGACGILAIVFVVLKLTDNIAWHWTLVLAPLWIPWALYLAFCFVCFSIAIVATYADRWRRRKAGLP